MRLCSAIGAPWRHRQEAQPVLGAGGGGVRIEDGTRLRYGAAMTKARFDGIVAIATVALAFAVARLLPFQDSATRAFIALAFALGGVLLGNRLWRRTAGRRPGRPGR